MTDAPELHPDDDPYVLQGPQPHPFWAESVAERILDRDPDDPIVIKGGISPSGVPHLGNMNEIVRGYFVAEALRDRGREVRQVFTADDRDPLRKLPRKLADLDGNVVDLGEVNAGALGRNLGKPYTAIPDPFGCCDSYGEHFSNLIERSAELLGIPVEMISNTDLYESGELEDVTHYLLENRETAREVLAEYQDKVDEEYVPFNPVCEECGKITETVTAVNLGETPAETTVEYVCTDMEAGDRTIEGCGHEGSATLREGKLPWRFEWPAQWRVLGVDHEPFGKDHAEGSWPSGSDVARNVLGDTPPVPMAYEWFTLDGEPFSSSSGHVIMVQDTLEMLEPEVVRYFFTKDPSKARDFDVSHLDQLVDEFDGFERVYFGEREADETEAEIADAAYPPVVRPTVAARFDEDGDPVSGPDRESVAVTDDIRRAQANELADGRFADRIRLPYTFAAVLGMTDDPDLREDIARREGHVAEADPEWAVAYALDRVERAQEWARRTDNAYNYDLKRTEMPDVDLDADTEAALDELADFVAEGRGPEEIQGEIYETAKRHDIAIGEFFSVGYRLFFDDDEGPKLGPFLASLDREFVLARLRREG
ncbi:lysine--tRNA ligase [Halorussus salilacus]|uniref:lysine--tRNA ligase n=1 Tax=Halorussus salilacus TaxID=2953750 RepID=UPI00209F0D8D|nr:lysine--tRNA ligase [Halorussus salilacus]USZ67194.1 lysine--tRNA ligase [Halorussus salilacus]